MKNIIAIIAMLLAATATQAQTLTPTNSGDTLTNADTVNLDQRIRGEWKSVSFQATVTKVSGTVAGNAIFYGSLDGVNYVAIGADTLTLSNAAKNTSVWTDSDAAYLHYRVQIITTGTQVSVCTGAVFRRKDNR